MHTGPSASAASATTPAVSVGDPGACDMFPQKLGFVLLKVKLYVFEA